VFLTHSLQKQSLLIKYLISLKILFLISVVGVSSNMLFHNKIPILSVIYKLIFVDISYGSDYISYIFKNNVHKTLFLIKLLIIILVILLYKEII